MIIWLLLVALVHGFQIPPRDYTSRDYFIVEIDTSNSSLPLHTFIAQNQYTFEHQVRGFDDHFVLSIDKNHPHSQFLGNYNSNNENLLKRDNQVYESLTETVKSIHMLQPKHLTKRMPVSVDFHSEKRAFQAIDSSQKPIQEASEKLGIDDPIFSQQWHLINAANPGHDVNVTGLWYEGITGKGVVTSIVDDGLDYEDEDLKQNFNAAGSWDFNDNTALPKPRLFNDYHGTRCAGEIAAVKNEVCGVGVAYESQVSGVRILSSAITSEDEAAAMIFGLDVNDIYSCSWGPNDDGKTLSAPEKIVKKAMIKGIQDGRDKKGAIYVFASGNGARFEDSCNFDGYTNSIYSITVGAIDYKGYHPSYAEACSAVMVVTYSSGSGEHIHTTDIHGKCSAQHGGTSAAAPLAAGIFALVLQANPDLTWRDLQYVAALSSVPVNEDDGHYQVTALQRKYSHKYGYGKIDAYKMAHFAKTWKNVKPQSWYYSDVIKVDESIKIDSPNSNDRTKIIRSSIIVNQRELQVVNLERVEHVTVTVNIKSAFRGQVGIRLVSPFGVVSDLATFRPRDSSEKGFEDWTFLSVAHWGENGIGEWTLEVFNNPTTQGNDITVENWQLRFFGESKDEKKVEVFDIDKDYAKVRRDELVKLLGPEASTSTSASETTATTKAPASTATTTDKDKASTATTKAADTTTDKAKATTTDKAKATTKANPTTAKPSATKTEAKDKATTSTTSTSTPSSTTSTEPDDGRNQITNDHKGLYFISLVVIGFAIILVIMKYHKTPGSSRRRRRRDEFEFDIIPGEDYSDSEIDSHDSFDLGHRNDQDLRANEERDRLYDELNGESLPDYEQDEEMFAIGDDEEEGGKKKVNFEDVVKDDEARNNINT